MNLIKATPGKALNLFKRTSGESSKLRRIFTFGSGKPSQSSSTFARSPIGTVAIVGAGPGDAELLTIKAYKALQNADIVLFDWLVDEAVLRMIPTHTAKEFVGKRAGQHSMPQEQISDRLVEHALSGNR
jgi:hypothetical protein